MFKKYSLIFVVSLVLYFAHAIYTKQGLYGDGNGYYSYTNAIYFQGNLDFKSIYEHFSNFHGRKYIFSRLFWREDLNPYLIGPGLIWLPSMVLISIVNFVFNLNADRFDLIYEFGPGITGVLLMVLGLFFLEKHLLDLRLFSKKAVFWTIVAIYFASNVFYYTALEPALSHQPSFFIICFLLWWSYKFKKNTKNLFFVGLISGTLAITRIVDVVLLIPIFWNIKPKKYEFIPILMGSLIGLCPQLANQYLKYGSLFAQPYLNGVSGTWQPNLIHLFEFLFSPKRGLFTWTPIMLIGFIELIKSKKWIFLSSITILWLISSSWSAYLSAGFGQRLSFSVIPYFAYGITSLFNRISTKKIIFIIFLFTIWNFALVKNVFLHKDLFIQKENFAYKEFFPYMFKLD